MLVAAVSACGGESGRSSEVQDDCLASLVWNEVTYEGASIKEPLTNGPRVADGVIPECRPEPERRVAVTTIRGVHPSVAVATPGPRDEYPGDDIVWLGPGYIALSPLHPLHDELRAAGWIPNSYAGGEWRCELPRIVRVWVRERPAALSGLLRVRSDEKTEQFITGDDVDTYVVVDERTAYVGLRRHGTPFINAGHELEATVRECFGTSKEPGLQGLRLVVASRLRGVAT
jgi:hypothetical protein